MATQPASPKAKEKIPFAHQPPQITILADHAAQDRPLHQHQGNTVAHIADRDLLALESRLSSTFDILRHKNTRCPLALAVYGEWGTGKTSAMRWLETKLTEWNAAKAERRGDHPRAYPIWFDPWRYHSREEVWRGIIAEVILGLFSVAQLNGQNFLPRMVEAAKKFGGFLGRSFLHALANLEFSASGKAKVPGVAEGEAGFTASGEMFREIWDEYQKTSQPQKAVLNQFEETLRSWVGGFLREIGGKDTVRPRLVIFIDDLDRCLPAVALEVLEALKLYLSIPQLIFVVGLDQDVVRAVVAKHYHDQGVSPEKAASYLHKLFQLELRIPPSEAQMSQYMQQQIEALNEATGGYWNDTLTLSGHGQVLDSALVRAAKNNPREVKRLLNSALIYGRNAALDVKLAEENPGEQAAALRFAQGIQVFLLQRVLGDELVNSRQVLGIERHLQWIEQTSKFLREFAQVSEWTLEMIGEELRCAKGIPDDDLAERVRETDRKGKKSWVQRPEVERNFLVLRGHMTAKTPDAESQAWFDIPFLELMQVPFSQAVAQCAPVLAASTKPAATTAFNLAQLPAFMRERMALAASVPTEHLAPDHLPQIGQLDLSGIHLTSADLRLLPVMEGLEVLKLTNCVKLESLPDLSACPQIKILDLDGCTGLKGAVAFEGLAKLRNLEVLWLRGCTGLESLPDLSACTRLKSLSLAGCGGLEGAAAFLRLAGLRSLEWLWLKGCTGLESLPDLSACTRLKRLDLRGCTGLKGAAALQGLARLRDLEELYLNDCMGLEALPDLSACAQLKMLDLSFCTGLKGAPALQGLAGLRSLEGLDLQDCTGLESLPDLSACSQLKSLNLSGCTGMKGAAALQGLTGLRSLEWLSLTGCMGLEMPDVRQIRGWVPQLCRVIGPHGEEVR